MDTIDIKDDEINVEEIMQQIRENIRKRKESGVYTREMETLINALKHCGNWKYPIRVFHSVSLPPS